MSVLQRVEVTVPGNRAAWTNSGVLVRAGESLRITAGGSILFDSRRHRYAFPEGTYADANSPTHAYNPGATVSDNVNLSRLPATNVRFGSLVVALRGGSEAPNAGIDCGAPIADALQGDRDVTFAPGIEGRVWLIFNDINTVDNSGNFTVTVERIGAFSPLSPGSVSPIRIVPPDMLREKQKSVENTALCWFIRPRTGAPEGYTEMDFDVACPQINFETGAADDGAPLYTTLPPLVYKPFSGLSISGVPTSVKLGVDAPDVTVIRFEQSKLRREYYEEAQVEVFEVPLDGDRSRPMLYLSGVLGNCQGDDLSAMIELTPWDELTNLPTGWKMGFICDVGRLPGEEFGTGRCTNLKRFDGIKIAEWTRGAQISQITSLSRLVIAPAAVAGFGGFEANFPGSHGIIQFVGGALDGLRRDIGKFDAGSGTLDLRRALPQIPDIGAQTTFKAGCDHTFDGDQGCIFWQQGRNFRGTPHLPGRKALRNRIQT